jgi:hypothetical protein
MGEIPATVPSMENISQTLLEQGQRIMAEHPVASQQMTDLIVSLAAQSQVQSALVATDGERELFQRLLTICQEIEALPAERVSALVGLVVNGPESLAHHLAGSLLMGLPMFRASHTLSEGDVAVD